MGLNAILSFFLEIAALAVYAWAPFAYMHGAIDLKVGVSGVLVVIFLALWARLAAPRSTRRLGGKWLIGFKAAIFGGAVMLLAKNLELAVLILGLLIVAINLSIEYRDAVKDKAD